MSYVIISSVERLAKAFSIQFETKMSFDTLIYTCLEQTRGIIEILPDIDGVILLKPVAAKELSFFLKKVDISNLKIVIPFDQECEIDLPRWTDEEDIFSLLQNENATEAPKAAKKDYYRVPISHLDILNTAPVDYYIMLGDERKYLKVINQSEDNFKMALAKLASRKIKKLYVKDDQLETMLLEVRKVSEKSKRSSDPIDHIKIQEETFALMQSIGFSSRALKLANSSINDMKIKLDGEVDTKKLLNTLYTKSTNKSYQLTYMTSLISVNIVSSFEWFDESMREALINASFFNDINLKEDDVFVRDLKRLKSVEGTDQLDLLEHALRNSESLRSTSLSHLEASCKIICEHHGDKSGRGFGNNLSELGKLSGIFIISEEFCSRLINTKDGKINVGSILKEISSIYTGKSVQVYCQAILNIFKAS